MATVTPLAGELRLVVYVGLQLQGQAPTVKVGATKLPGAGSLSLGSDAPSVEIDHFKTNDTASLAFSSDAPQRTVTVLRTPTAGSLSLSSNAVSVLDNPRKPSVVSLSFSSDAPASLIAVYSPSGSLSLTGSTPEITRFADPSIASVTFSSDAVTVAVGQGVSPSVGTLSFSADINTISMGYGMPVGSAAFSTYAPAINVANAGTSITNENATTDVPSNYEICDYTGFRQLPGSLKLTWNKYAVRRKSWEERNAQEFARSFPEKRKGSRRSEQDDQFIEDLYPNDVDPDTDL